MDPDNQSQSTTSEAVIPIALHVMAGQNVAPITGRECVCQVFFQQLPGLNNWKFIFTISPEV